MWGVIVIVIIYDKGCATPCGGSRGGEQVDDGRDLRGEAGGDLVGD